MLFVKNGKPVVFDYVNNLVKELKTATLSNSIEELSQVSPISCSECCEGVVWSAIFDPGYFKENEVFSILWSGTDLNGSAFSDLEENLVIKYNNDFYPSFVELLKQSMSNDKEDCNYNVNAILSSIDYASCLINSVPPFTNCSPDQQPCSFLLDLVKSQLYKNQAGKEAGESFTYNDIGKSFSFDVSSKLLQIGESLERSAMENLKLYKRNLRPDFKGLASRYSRGTRNTLRSFYIHRQIYRNNVR